MKLLKLNYHIFNLLCICPPDDSCSQFIKFRNIIVLILNILLMFIGCFSSVIFIAKYFSVDLENSLGAGFQVGAATPTFYTIIAALILRDDIMKIFIDIQMIYELSKFVNIFVQQSNLGLQDHFNFTYFPFFFRRQA